VWLGDLFLSRHSHTVMVSRGADNGRVRVRVRRKDRVFSLSFSGPPGGNGMGLGILGGKEKRGEGGVGRVQRVPTTRLISCYSMHTYRLGATNNTPDI